MRYRIIASSNVPIFRQIADQIARAVVTGDLNVGDSVPSIRQLARDLVINPNTVAKAYSNLVGSRVLETQPGRGYFISKRRQVFTKTKRLRRLDETIDVLINQSVSLNFSVTKIVKRVKDSFKQKLSVAQE